MRVGLVLGAGGVVGASWLIGALQALEQETGFPPTAADWIIGTSAGAVVGALSAGGIAPASMAAYASGAPIEQIADLEGIAEAPGRRSVAEAYRVRLFPPPLGPGSWRMAAATLANPGPRSGTMLVSALLPRGIMRTIPISDLVERFIPGHWPEHPGFRAVACDYASGARVVFGSATAPDLPVGKAVAASCAIPAFYEPLRFEGRRYIDGGIHSPSNLDLTAELELDLVICLNPMSSLASVPARSRADRLAAVVRARAGRRLGGELRALRASGTQVLALQPGAADLAVMGANLMARDRRIEVLQTARMTTVRALRRLGPAQLLPDSGAARRPPRAA